ncbi:DUF1127 domain-containing protein [Phyllobacterium sp. 628]|uniref:DUF1127 domain-containing protein n=1 Tax=Phyllobacterium sp. 628 TaxID=2718938 RepID=UPI0016624B43|nr:DUF1127 domain-containing protein [Phyllobacterium sp. 628]QND53279.1 DUF1127 domain-containing protein [Phyllobacterium sp. 628]
MSIYKTTGLLESVEFNHIAKQRESHSLLLVIQKGIIQAWKNARAQVDRSNEQRVSKLSDHLLADIGITRQEAEEIDARKAK